LIVFFAAIRETLKREIYRGHKLLCWLDENKGLAAAGAAIATLNHEFIQSGLRMPMAKPDAQVLQQSISSGT